MGEEREGCAKEIDDRQLVSLGGAGGALKKKEIDQTRLVTRGVERHGEA